MKLLVIDEYRVSQNKGSPNKKKYLKYLSLCMDTVSYMILTDVMSTIIDQKIIEFELLSFELCPFLPKYP